MKKIILSLLITACMFCTMVSCGTSEKNEETDLNTENRNEVQTENEDIKQIIVPYYDENVKKYGYCTVDGELVIAPEFDEANFFYENAAAVRVDNLWGFVNETGVFIVEPKFHYAHNFSEGLASVRLDDLNGESKWGFIDKTGEFAINPEFDSASSFAYGFCSVWVGHSMGFIDKNGNIVIEPQFHGGDFFCKNKLAGVMLNGKWGFINERGEFVIEPKFDEAWGFTECDGNYLAPVCSNGKWGFINENGEFEIEPMFDDASHFTKNGIAPVSLGGKWGCIDIKGNWTIEPQFDRLMNPRNGLISFAVGIDPYTQKWGYIDEQGNVVLDAIYDSAGPFNDGVANVRIGDFQDGIEHYINREGEIIRPAKQKLEEMEGATSKQELYFKTLNECIKSGKNPLDNEIIVNALNNKMGDTLSLVTKESKIINTLYVAPALYRDLFLYSFFDYEYDIFPASEGSWYTPQFDAIVGFEFDPINGNMVHLSNDWDKDYSAFYHETGHAIDINAKMYFNTSWATKNNLLLDEWLYVDVKTTVEKTIEKYIKDNNLKLSTSDQLEIVKAIMSAPTLNSAFEGLLDGTKKKIAIEVCRILTNELAEAEKAANGKNDSMVADVYGGMTNNKIYTGFGHTTPYYWFDENGKSTKYQNAEAWAEFFAAKITKNTAVEKVNEKYFSSTCAALETLAEEMLDYYKEKYSNF